MSTYVIGDVHGCIKELQHLLRLINYDPRSDTLWFCGDIVNRGPASLEALVLVKDLIKQNPRNLMVLGNHDLHLIAVFYGQRELQASDTFQEILNSSRAKSLIKWLRHQQISHFSAQHNSLLVHAGVLPTWGLTKVYNLSREVTDYLRADNSDFLDVFGNKPVIWKNSLRGSKRMRLLLNIFTRMRFIDDNYELNFKFNGDIKSANTKWRPWFSHPRKDNTKIIFGHWAALNGKTGKAKYINVDTGCVWGGALCAFNLDTEKQYLVPSQINK